MKNLRLVLSVAFATLAFLLAYAQIFKGWVADLISDPNYGHGLVLGGLLIALAIWRSLKGDESGERGLAPIWWGWALMALLAAVGGLLVANDSLLRWSLILAVLAAVESLAPAKIVSAWRGPLLALLLLVPWPYVLYYGATAHLQRMSSAAAAFVLHWSGVPLAREGNLLHFAGYDLEVVEACSGLRSLLVMSALAAFIAAAARLSVRRTLFLLLLSVPLALGANLLRLVLTGYGAQLGGPETAENLFHLGGGLLSFALGVIVLGMAAFIRRGTRS
ncbi:MAG TPA: exosortase/archaeosortase family protein [Candidatus Krumholzibacteria bacterium]|nr:exosortase/archaeosortase family protein [Candidatus Krumholzibacteria bacterium]